MAVEPSDESMVKAVDESLVDESIVNAVDESIAKAVEELGDEKSKTRAAACDVLAEAGDKASEHFDKMLQLMKEDDDMSVKRAAACAVAILGKDRAEDAIPALEGALNSEDSGMRANAALGLGRLKATATVGALGVLLTDANLCVRSAGLAGISAMGESAASTAAAVAGRLSEPMLRSQAVATLGKLGEAGAAFAGELVSFLVDSDLEVRMEVAATLGDMVAHVSDDVVDEVAELLNHRNHRFRATAAVALGQFGPEKAGRHVEAIAGLLEHPEVFANEPGLPPAAAAAVALGRLGSNGTQIAALCASKSPQLRLSACEGIAELGEHGAAYIKNVALCLNDQEEDVQSTALHALEKLSKSATLDDELLRKMAMMRISFDNM